MYLCAEKDYGIYNLSSNSIGTILVYSILTRVAVEAEEFR